MQRILGIFLAVCGLLAASTPALAHHSFTAEFDGSKVITISGTLTKVDWVNPHTYFYVDVKDENGKVTNWAIEANPTGMMHRAGATRNMFVEGQTVTVTVNPAKDGTKALGCLRHITFQNGNQINLKDNNNGNSEDGK